MEKLTQERLKELLNYDPETGVFIWKRYRNSNALAGSVAGSLMADGYIRMMVDGRRHMAHRLAWLYIHGYFPENQIDHINRVRNDNRTSNLREVSAKCNMRNTGVRSTNTSGVVGVSWREEHKRWVAQIRAGGKVIHLGNYIDFADAVLARWKAEKEYGFQNCCSDSSAYQYLLDNNTIKE